MRSLAFFLIWGFFFQASAQLVERAGVPRMVRTQKVTEVFFVDLKDSYWIADDSKHNTLMNAFLKGAKDRKAVSFVADEKSRRVMKLADPSEKPAQDKKSNFEDGQK